jgi:chromosome segregation ATPase
MIGRWLSLETQQAIAERDEARRELAAARGLVQQLEADIAALRKEVAVERRGRADMAEMHRDLLVRHEQVKAELRQLQQDPDRTYMARLKRFCAAQENRLAAAEGRPVREMPPW